MHMLADPTAVKLEPAQLSRLARMSVRSASSGQFVRAEVGAAPMATAVRTACRHDGAPLLQFDRAGHDGPVTLVVENPLAGLTVGVQGQLVETDRNDIDRFFRRHTEAEATDASVAVYRIDVSRVYVETGDGAVRWVDTYLIPIKAGDLAEAEAGIVEHVNGGHPDTIHAILSHRGIGADDWVMTGADPEGVDVARGEHTLRIAFDTPVHSREAFKKTMVALRAAGGGQAAPPQQAAAAE